MFKSFINPQKIIGNGTKAARPEAFSNFMSGGKAALGSSVSSGAANNISSFARSGIAAAGNSNITPSITNISTSIINNVDNSVSNVINSFKSQVQSVLGGVQSNLSATIQNFSKDYQQRIQNKEDNKPSNILKGFLGLYQNAINFVTFFGDSKNNKKIEFTLKSLRNMFSDSFNTAAIIRQTIVRIVKQLSNLPTASGASGGLNLDVKVPGGALKQSGRATLSKFAGSRGGKLFGAGVVGAGAIGLGMMGMQSAKASQEEKLAETAKKGVGGEDKPNDFMKGLNSIAERFSDAIDSLLGRSKKPPGGGGASSGGGGGSPGAAPPPGAGAATPEINTTGAKGVLDLIASVEQGPTGYDSFNQSAGKTSGKATEKTIGWLEKNAQGAIGRYQHMPAYILDRAKAAGYNENTLFTPEVQDVITIKQLRTEHNLDSFLSGTMSAEQFQTKLAPTWRGIAQGEANARKVGGTADSTYNDTAAGRNRAGITSAKTVTQLRKIQSGSNTQTPSTATPQAAQKPPSTVKPAPASTVNAAPPTQKAQEVSQAVTAPPGQDVNEVKVASIPAEFTNISLGGSQDGGGAVASLPAPSFAGPNVSGFGDTKNEDNPYWFISQMLGVTA